MRISINLASRPFVELRPLLARLRLAMVVLALLGVGLGAGLHSLRARARLATAQMDALKAQTVVVEQERAQNEKRMREPRNMGVLERSQFLNALFARKSFSWTAVMMDLERVLPGGVQVTSIEPVIDKTGEVQIRLRVTGDRDRAVQLVRNLERSQRFLAPRLAGESSLTAEKARAFGQPGVPVNVSAGAEAVGNGVEFEIFSGYNPLPEETAKAAKADQGSADETQPVVHHDRKARPR